MKAKDYFIQKDKKGKDVFKCTIEWCNEDGERLKITTTDLERAATTIGLLAGDICLADLEP